jgi:hypothetical protein
MRNAIHENSFNLYDVKGIKIIGDSTYGVNHVLTIEVKANDGSLYAIYLHNPTAAIKLTVKA